MWSTQLNPYWILGSNDYLVSYLNSSSTGSPGHQRCEGGAWAICTSKVNSLFYTSSHIRVNFIEDSILHLEISWYSLTPYYTPGTCRSEPCLHARIAPWSWGHCWPIQGVGLNLSLFQKFSLHSLGNCRHKQMKGQAAGQVGWNYLGVYIAASILCRETKTFPQISIQSWGKNQPCILFSRFW